MNRISIAFLAVIVSLAGLQGCKKYEEGPYISFLSKEARVTNTWHAKNVLRDLDDYTPWFEDMTIDLREDGRWTITDKDDLDSTFTQEGFWDLINDKEQIRMLFSDPPVNPDRKDYDILKLKDEELWIREITDSVTWTFHLIPGAAPSTLR